MKLMPCRHIRILIAVDVYFEINRLPCTVLSYIKYFHGKCLCFSLFRCTGERFDEYHNSNIWPEEVPDLEFCFKEMGSVMYNCATIVADLFDRWLFWRFVSILLVVLLQLSCFLEYISWCFCLQLFGQRAQWGIYPGKNITSVETITDTKSSWPGLFSKQFPILVWEA